MTQRTTRRDILKGSLAVMGLGMLNLPEWVLPALAQGETLVPFTDMPANFPEGRGETRLYDIRTIDGPFTPADRFYTVQHYGHPVVDPVSFQLKVTGLVNRPASLSIEELRRMGGRSWWLDSSARGIGGRCRACAATGAGRASRCARSSSALA